MQSLCAKSPSTSFGRLTVSHLACRPEDLNCMSAIAVRLNAIPEAVSGAPCWLSQFATFLLNLLRAGGSKFVIRNSSISISSSTAVNDRVCRRTVGLVPTLIA